MSSRRILDLVRRLGAEERVSLTEHAQEEAAKEGCTRADVFFALEHAEEAVVEDAKRHKWKVYGPALNRTELAVVTLIIENQELRVITVHLPP